MTPPQLQFILAPPKSPVQRLRNREFAQPIPRLRQRRNYSPMIM